LRQFTETVATRRFSGRWLGREIQAATDSKAAPEGRLPLGYNSRKTIGISDSST
jgi:hypothetical protein